jgi:predicted nucleic acid-binding protein
MSLTMPSTDAWVDTGFLVALFARNDPHHASAVEFLTKTQRLKSIPVVYGVPDLITQTRSR